MDRSVEQLVDEILILDCQSGSAKAPEILVSRWQKRLWKYAYNLTGDADASWDVTQESWLSIIKGLRKLNDPAKFRAWAYRIITNKSTDWIRKNKTVKKVGLDEIEEQQLEKKNLDVKELLEKLDIGKKVVLSLYYFEQLSVSEISVALKIPKGTVKSRLHGARKELKELYQKHFE
ncbi:MAG: RNA polymerase sigma factor [Sedimentisphaerales bacterium]|nr:RNA polymerase sigma factor [Sedimentisphaerales bacterium]